MTPSKPLSQMTPAEKASFLAKVKQFEASQKAMNQPSSKVMNELPVEARYPKSIPRIVKEPVGTLATDEPRLRAAPQKQVLQKMSPARGRGPIPTMKSGGKVSSASKRADGCAVKGKTRGRMV